MKLNKIHHLFVIVFFALVSCKKEESLDNSYLGYDYYPQDTAKFIIYNVKEITWDDFFIPPAIDTNEYKLKELNESYFIDDEGRKCVRIERYKKSNDTTNWELVNVWTSCVTNRLVEKTEGNIKYVKLVFPIKENQYWNGNLYNMEEEQDYTMVDAHQPYSINNLTFDSTVTINQNDEVSLISKDIQAEIYARKIGLIYKRILQIETETNGEVKSGFDITYEIDEWN